MIHADHKKAPRPKKTEQELLMEMPFAEYLHMIGGVLKRNKHKEPKDDRGPEA